jgi:hypothetical protein
MMDKNVEQPTEDAAWISGDLPLPSGEVYAFTQKLERLYRLNPHLEIKSWQEEAPGKIASGKQFRIETLNEMNGLNQRMVLSVKDVQPGVTFSLNYDSGLKQATIFTVQVLSPGSARLVVKELYPAEMSAAERGKRLNEVDRSLVPWGAAIHSYCIRRTRWGWLPFYSWFQDKFWLGMVPRQRRIARLIIWTTALEFVIFLFVFVIYWLELGRGYL